MLKSALPPAFLLLSACTAPPPPASEPPSAPAADSAAEKGAAAEPTTPAVLMATSDAHAEASPTRTLFLANCAQCHGEKGDGEGVTQLDRKARSFLDGGFSYGNTKDAILRSITHGIPGTPMPPFEKALSEAQRVELAAYVIAFGPDQIVVDPSESEIVVKDRPVIVRGKLPAIVEGAPEYARGLAIGTPDGLTFEYRTDDVQLVGVRAGRFLNRSDWGERGGTALEMLGKPVWIVGPTDRLLDVDLKRCGNTDVRGDHGVAAHLIATDVRANGAWIEYSIATSDRDDAGRAIVRETCSSYRNTIGSGFCVRRTVRAQSDGLCVQLTDFQGPMPFLTAGKARTSWRIETGTLVVMIARNGIALDSDGWASVTLPLGAAAEIEVYVLTDTSSQFREDSKALDELVRREFQL